MRRAEFQGANINCPSARERLDGKTCASTPVVGQRSGFWCRLRQFPAGQGRAPYTRAGGEAFRIELPERVSRRHKPHPGAGRPDDRRGRVCRRAATALARQGPARMTARGGGMSGASVRRTNEKPRRKARALHGPRPVAGAGRGSAQALAAVAPVRANFWRNFSTRPVSMMRCWAPV